MGKAGNQRASIFPENRGNSTFPVFHKKEEVLIYLKNENRKISKNLKRSKSGDVCKRVQAFPVTYLLTCSLLMPMCFGRSGVSGASGVFDDRAEKRCRFEASAGRVTRLLPYALRYRYHACFYVFLFSGACNKRAKLSKVAEMLAFFDLKKV